MASIILGYSYDIFISYRQKDNKYDGWVNDFVDNLRKELEATFKEEISIYFDENPHDGILDTYDVGKSLEGKLKCLILIPIISQTYCDPKSFAWQNEFIAFNRLAINDAIGSRVKLSNGNVTGRILPVKIHDLDLADKALLESELGGPIRSVDFIYKSQGVNRPLKPDDSRTENLNHSYYRDQINKVANAVKDIISSLKNQGNEQIHPSLIHTSSGQRSGTLKLTFRLILLAAILVISGYFILQTFSKNPDESIGESIAILPFEVISKDHDMDFLGEGFAESIGDALGEIKGLKVIGRNSSSQFDNKKTDPEYIGQKLQVSTILQGSLQILGNELRISVKLVNTKDGSTFWTEKFPADLITNSWFTIQDEIAEKLLEKFKMKGEDNPKTPKAINLDAYEMLVKGRYYLKLGPEGGKKALSFFQSAVKIDPRYADAYLGLGMSYFFTGSKTKMKEALDMGHRLNGNESWYHGYMIAYNFVFDWNWEGVRSEYEKWLKFNSPGHIGYAWYLASLYGKVNDAIQEMEMYLNKDPLNSDGIRNLSTFYIMNDQFEDARRNLMRIIETNPSYASAYERMGYSYYREGNYEKAIELYEKSDSINRQLSTKIEIVIALAHSGQKEEAKRIFDQLLNDDELITQDLFWIGMSPGGGHSVSIAMAYFSFGEPDEAFKWLNKAYEDKEGMMIGLKIDPIYDPFRNDPRFISIYKKMKFPE